MANPTYGYTKCHRCGQPGIPPAKKQCVYCKAYANEVLSGGNSKAARFGDTLSLDEVEAQSYERWSSGPWDFVMWGNDEEGSEEPKKWGPVPSSVILIGGEPGAGKSTLSLQWAGALAGTFTKPDDYILYLASEESKAMIKGRAIRLGVTALTRIRVKEMLGGETRPVEFLNTLQQFPKVVVLDSTKLYEAFLEEELKGIKALMVKHNAIAILVHQVNKDLNFVGEMSIQHAVDVTTAFVSRQDGTQFREFYAVKNRMGCTLQPVIFEMGAKGLTFVGRKKDIEVEEEGGRKGKKPAKKPESVKLSSKQESLERPEIDDSDSDDTDTDTDLVTIPYGTIPLDEAFFQVNTKGTDIEFEVDGVPQTVDPETLLNALKEAHSTWKADSEAGNTDTDVLDLLIDSLTIAGFEWADP